MHVPIGATYYVPHQGRTPSFRYLREGMAGLSVGSYSEESGIERIKSHVASYIEKRDEGVPSHKDDVILQNGASDAIWANTNSFCTIPGIFE